MKVSKHSEETKTAMICGSCKQGRMIKVVENKTMIGEFGPVGLPPDTQFFYCDGCGNMQRFIPGYSDN